MAKGRTCRGALRFYLPPLAGEVGPGVAAREGGKAHGRTELFSSRSKVTPPLGALRRDYDLRPERPHLESTSRAHPVVSGFFRAGRQALPIQLPYNIVHFSLGPNRRLNHLIDGAQQPWRRRGKRGCVGDGVVYDAKHDSCFFGLFS